MSARARRAKQWRRQWKPVPHAPAGLPMTRWTPGPGLVRRRVRFHRQAGWYGRRDSWHWTQSGRLSRDVRPLAIDGHAYRRRLRARRRS